MKTFTVPYTSDIFNVNISINTNLTPELSKEKILRCAFKYHCEGKLLEAAKYYRIYIDNGFLDYRAFYNYGTILKKQGKSKKAIYCFINAIKINPNNSIPYYYVTKLLGLTEPSQFRNDELRFILDLILRRKDISCQELFIAFNYLYQKELADYYIHLENDNYIKKLFNKLSNNKLFIIALQRLNFTDVKWEKLLTSIRSHYIFLIANEQSHINESELQFIIGLAHQCFLNEYIYSLTSSEDMLFNLIVSRSIESKLQEEKISILACYSPLYKLLDRIPRIKSFNSSNKLFLELLKLQVLEPLVEIKLSKQINKLGLINDDISLKVSSQYHENPYPRWIYFNPLGNSKYSGIQRINMSIKPNLIKDTFKPDILNILVAGCGTGRHIINVLDYKNSKITAIDISLSSLSYAKRKLNELGIDNVDLFHMDILEVELLKKNFDIIECSGVLHHMKNPLKGLDKLLSILNPNGFIKLGLYSELSRKDVVKAREHIFKKNLNSTCKDIRIFRDDVISGHFPEIVNIKFRHSFYSLSECRDLCFNFQEHRFTIPQLINIFDSKELNFHGFVLPNAIKSKYNHFFPADKKQINLQHWAKFEEKFPNTFRGMYQLWLSRK